MELAHKIAHADMAAPDRESVALELFIQAIPDLDLRSYLSV